MACIGAWVRTLLSRVLLICVFIVFLPFFIIVLPLPNRWFYRNPVYYWCIDILYRVIIKLSLLPVQFKGLEHIPDDTELIFAANHQSSLDIPLVGRLVKRYPHVWLATMTLTDSWVYRIWLPYISSVLLIDAEKPRKAMRTVLRSIKLAQYNKMHLIIFPEGMRHTDGDVHEFFFGFATLARRMKRPVVPVRIFGANKAYPPDSFLVQHHPITVVVGEPFYFQEGKETREAFSDRVRAWFLEQKP